MHNLNICRGVKFLATSAQTTVCIEAETVQIGCTESPLTSFLFALSFYGESLGGHGFVLVLYTIALQTSLNKAHGEFTFRYSNIDIPLGSIPQKIGEIWRSVFANISKPAGREKGRENDENTSMISYVVFHPLRSWTQDLGDGLYR